jgi:3-phenylpropionate/trans-cinnamate dioxygenase ferredoxin reductase component
VTRFDYVIVGGGMTGDAAAHGIRKEDPRGTVAVLSAEPHAPYNRPPLTKGLWKGDDPESIWRKTQDTGAELVLGRQVAKLDPATSQVIDDRGTAYQYGTLLLATGGTPRRLPDAPEGVVYFRSLDDYRRTRELANGKASFVVIGGGFIGSEIAAGIRMQDCEVTMIVKDSGIGSRIFPPDLSRWLADYYRQKGVTVRLDERVGRVESRDGKYQVSVAKDETIEADAVVAGLGIEPNVDLARAAGLRVGDGIEVDEQLRTSRPQVYAAGDVASFANPALGARIRVEHEDNANTMGEVAGRNMAGAARRYDHLPFFYSDLFDLGYEAVGDVSARHQAVADWKEKFREGVVYYLQGGRVRGVLLWNVWNQVDAARALIAEPGPFRPEQLKGRLPAG